MVERNITLTLKAEEIRVGNGYCGPVHIYPNGQYNCNNPTARLDHSRTVSPENNYIHFLFPSQNYMSGIISFDRNPKHLWLNYSTHEKNGNMSLSLYANGAFDLIFVPYPYMLKQSKGSKLLGLSPKAIKIKNTVITTVGSKGLSLPEHLKVASETYDSLKVGCSIKEYPLPEVATLEQLMKEINSIPISHIPQKVNTN